VIPRERLGSRSIFVLLICLVHLGIIAWFDRSPATSSASVEDEPTLHLTFFDEPLRTDPPNAHSVASHSANNKGSRNSKAALRTEASPTRLDVPADMSAAAPQILAPEVDWIAEGQRTAQDYISRTTRADSLRALDRPSTGPRLLRSPSRVHQLGDTDHFDGGEIIDWINDRCYYSNRDPSGNLPPMHGVTGLAPAYLTGEPICKPR
jgi:hypothetical protein